ncbi:MAG: hypothetical protein GF398_11465 [Chitinivibrionales bacterium]|nr:hypothetical protein [Chitinivibrionales bacterium]
MIQRPRLRYLNIDFDLRLGGYDTTQRSRSIAEGTLYYALTGYARDKAILEVEPSPAWYDYLNQCGVEFASPPSRADKAKGCTASPWGWNRSAVQVYSSLQADIQHPPLDAVRRANSRLFSYTIAGKYDLGVPDTIHFTDTKALTAYLSRARNHPHVIKTSHGHAGMGFRHVSPGCAQEPILGSLPQQGDFFVEPWLKRREDFSVRYDLDTTGGIRDLSLHETQNNSAGVFYGIYLDPHQRRLQPWRERMIRTAHIVARQLHAIGYFGPVGIDALVYTNSAGNPQLASLLEINARDTMSSIACALRDKLHARDRHCLLMLAPHKRYTMPGDPAQFISKLGAAHYAPGRQSGIFLFTPLSYEHRSQAYTPTRHGFFMIGNSRGEVFRLDELVRRTFAKRSTSHAASG